MVTRRALLVTASTLILLAGSFGAGLYIAWIARPVQPVGLSPAALKLQEKELYIALVADAYALEGDLPAARRRLEALEAANLPQWTADLAWRAAGAGQARRARRLARLAVALGSGDQDLRELAGLRPGGPATPPPPTPPPEPTATPEALPTVVEAGQFDWVVAARQPITCGQGLAEQRLLVVRVEDGRGEPLPGVPLRVAWQGGEERFFTGLHPDDPGYADFLLAEGERYAVRVDEGRSEIALDLTTAELAAQCTDDVDPEQPIGWFVLFRRAR